MTSSPAAAGAGLASHAAPPAPPPAALLPPQGKAKKQAAQPPQPTVDTPASLDKLQKALLEYLQKRPGGKGARRLQPPPPPTPHPLPPPWLQLRACPPRCPASAPAEHLPKVGIFARSCSLAPAMGLKRFILSRGAHFQYIEM
jgi:hypothetical protein